MTAKYTASSSNRKKDLENYFLKITNDHKKVLKQGIESKYNDIDEHLSKMDISLTNLFDIAPVYTLIYFNHNEFMAENFPRTVAAKQKLYNHILKVNLKDDFYKEEMLQFLMWTIGSWKDEAYSRMVEKFCKSLTLDNRCLLARLRNLVRDFVHFEKTLEIIDNACKKLNITGPYEELIRTTEDVVYED